MEFRCKSIASNWEGNWCKKLSRKKVSQSQRGTEEILVTFGKSYLPSIPCMVPETPHSSAATKYLPQNHVVPSSTSESTERMRPLTFPTAEISIIELIFSILLLDYDAMLLSQKPLNHKKRTILM